MRCGNCKHFVPISTHALREEGDLERYEIQAFWQDFYPRPPRGGRRDAYGPYGKDDEISTHALREEGDGKIQQLLLADNISTHALREEGDAVG